MVPLMSVQMTPQMDQLANSFQGGLQLGQQQQQQQATHAHKPCPKDKATYLKELLADKIRISQLPNMFIHVEKMLDDEIARTRAILFETSESAPLRLPNEAGKNVVLTKKIMVPQAAYPDYNFVGRILGPRGLTLKQIEQETGCKIKIRGAGSMRNKATEEANRGKPDWEHLNEPLHVLLTVEDTQSRSNLRLQRAQSEIERLLVPGVEGEDNLKRKQLIELALLNGTYRDNVQPKVTMKKSGKGKSKKARAAQAAAAAQIPTFHPQQQQPISMLNSTWYCWADDQQQQQQQPHT